MSAIEPGSIVLLHLVNPSEKFWGVLEDLSPAGVTLRGLGLESFEDWVAQAAAASSGALGLSTMFVPLLRVERLFLDQQVGEVSSYKQRFERRVGVPLSVFLGVEEAEGLGLAGDDVDDSVPS